MDNYRQAITSNRKDSAMGLVQGDNIDYGNLIGTEGFMQA